MSRIVIVISAVEFVNTKKMTPPFIVFVRVPEKELWIWLSDRYGDLYKITFVRGP
jgi:hypothetical protein